MDSRNEQLARNTVILLIGKVLTQFINFILLPLYTAILSPEEYGIFDLFNTYIVLLLPIVSLHLDLGLFRFMLDERDNIEHHKTLFSTFFLVNILSCGIFLLIFLSIHNWISSDYKYFLLLNVVLNVFSSLLLQFSRGLGHNFKYSFGSLLSASITAFSNIILVVFCNVGVVGLFWSVIIGQFCLIIYLFFSLNLLQYISIKSISFHCVKPVLKYSLPLIPANLSWWTINASDRTVISFFLSIAANGIYSISNKFPSLINMFYSVFHMAWMETVTLHIDDKDRDIFLSNTINKLFVFFFSICVMFVACMPFIFKNFVNESYNQAYFLIPILIFASFFSILSGLFSVIFLAKKDTKESVTTAFICAVINIVVDLIFIKKIGLYAPALSTLFSYLIMACYRYVRVRRYVNLEINIYNFVSFLSLSIYVCFSYYLNDFIFSLSSLIFSVIFFICVNKFFILESFNKINFILLRHSGGIK